MRKIVLTLLLIITKMSFAQHYEIISIEEFPSIDSLCFTENTYGIIIHGETNCNNQQWSYIDINSYATATCESITIERNGTIHLGNTIEYIDWDFYVISYIGCEINNISHYMAIGEYPINPFVAPITWKRTGETITLETQNTNSNSSWSTGEHSNAIEVTQCGTYSVTIENAVCGSATYSVEVRDNVEAYRATVDLRTNKNKVTWQVTPEQAEYITDVKVYRDDVLVGTAPYTNGYFLDAIGSDAAARNYRIVGVAIEGDDCPIPSYEKGTIHTTYYEDVDGNLNMTWNTPYIEEGAQGTLTGYQICKYNPATEEVTVVDQVNASITDYTCNTVAFTGGQATIAAIFDSKDVEDRAFSNLTDHTFAVSEENETNFMVYPNPSNGTFIVEGASDLTIYNTIGQIIAKSHNEEEKHSFSLGSGIYFIKSDEGAVKKVVVE